jgi:hypothetical protein
MCLILVRWNMGKSDHSPQDSDISIHEPLVEEWANMSVGSFLDDFWDSR